MIFESFRAWLELDNQLEGEEKYVVGANETRQEATIRGRLAKASESGGLLSAEACSRFDLRPPAEPRKQFGTWAYVCSHAVHFSSLVRQEHVEHVKKARIMAEAAKHAINSVERWTFLRQAKSAEQIWKEEISFQTKRYKQLVKDVETKWSMVRHEVNRIKLARWEQEQEILGNKALDEMLDQSTILLHQHRYASEVTTHDPMSRTESVRNEDGTTATRDDEEASSAQAGASEDGYNMSESSDDESTDGYVDDDGNLTQEQLLQKYAHVLEQSLSSSDGSENEELGNENIGMDEMLDSALVQNEATPAALSSENISNLDKTRLNAIISGNRYDHVEVEDIDPELLDDSEASSTDMSSDMGSSQEASDENDEDGSDVEEDESDTGGYSLLNLYFSKQEQFAEKSMNASGEEAEAAPFEMTNADLALQDAPMTNGTIADGSETQAVSEQASFDGDVAASTPRVESDVPVATPTPTTSTTMTSRPARIEVSPLLRGTLRDYQHDGVDWLAKLYMGDRSGILADEMGLGKTIQTIGLLAYLATHHGVWGPHLVVVPTSVILNWEMEFKKWCPAFKILTYYGSIEERKRKRQGWKDDDKWNVIITSYQLILQDAQAFKARAWHYLILDEAHNIKNFQTQRWQTLLTFRTNSRLLLTGTPLQNNLQELWSLLYFLMPSGTDGAGGFADLEIFLNSMKRPADQILDQGRQILDPEAQARVSKLHEILRPFLLRRLKSEVEKQMPGKYEHVVYCRLSKRQRQLYDEFMGRADTKRTLSSGNYMSIINCLMSLRKVCNHPDLFETRQIVTSLAMSRSAVVDYEIKELMIRRRLLTEEPLDLDFCGLLPVQNESLTRREAFRSTQLQASRQLEGIMAKESRRLQSLKPEAGSGAQSILLRMTIEAQKSVVWELQNRVEHVKRSTRRCPIYGQDLVGLATLHSRFQPPRPRRKRLQVDYSYGELYLDTPVLIREMMPTVEQISGRNETIVAKFGCVTPAVVAEDVTKLTLTEAGQEMVQLVQQQNHGVDPYHEARIRQSIAFPDKRLLQYDCGKLQRLDGLLRQLQAEGHRCLIFTQMTRVLDILEQFLNIHGHRYLRLDGSTKIEQRQILTDRFNNDNRILAFILSSRSGGLGINLTGADTVIFYDLDWNPAMDAQCQDRCHRIGQTRDVHIYRFVSEFTIEANILRKSNQKRLLDDVIIQKGEFTTDYFNRVTYHDALEGILETDADPDASAAMDRVLGDLAGLGTVLESVEDKEDTAAAKAAQKEMVHMDDVDFKETAEVTPKTSVPPTPAEALEATIQDEIDSENEEPGHVDDYMVKWMMEDLKDVAIRLPKPRGMKSKRKK
jgi:helicase SWR1